MYECIEIPEQPTNTTSTSTTSSSATSTSTSMTVASSTSATITTSTTAETSKPTLSWRDGMDHRQLKALRNLAISELVIAFLLLGASLKVNP